MSLSNTGGGGRGSDAGTIVGDVILHGKRKYWSRGANWHYHRGMAAGERALGVRANRAARALRQERARSRHALRTTWLGLAAS